jgi:hypothetical protein
MNDSPTSKPIMVASIPSQAKSILTGNQYVRPSCSYIDGFLPRDIVLLLFK